MNPFAIVVILGLVAMPLDSAISQQDPAASRPMDNRAAAAETRVPLRDFLSTVIDSLRAELLDRMDKQAAQVLQLMDERDRRYQQRFEAQRLAVETAIESSRVANDKAQDASDKRFDSVNEFRETLADQTREFVRRETFEASVSGLDARILEMSRQIDAVLARDEGAANLWGYLVGGAGVIFAILAFSGTWTRREAPPPAQPKR